MLPSQTARPTSSRSHMYRRHRSRRVPAIIGVILLIVACLVVLKWWRGGAEPNNAMANEPAVTPAVVERPAPRNAITNSTTSSPADRVASPSAAMRDVPPRAASAVPTQASSPVTESSPQGKISMGSALPPPQPPATKMEAPKPEAPKPEPARTAPDLGGKSPTTINPPSTSPATPPTPAANQPITPTSQRLKAGLDLIAQNKPIEARAMLSSAMLTTGLTPADAERIRTELTKLNQRLVFGPEIVPGDPFVSAYTIEGGDSLAKLPRKLSLNVDWRFLQRINNISAPERIRVGQRIKIVKGPFHAIVHKPTFRMDLYMGHGSDRVYVRSFKVGLGEFGATPEGEFMVKPSSKLVDPAWTNPRTGEHFASGDPNNPLGKFWIGLIGTSDNIRDLETYGIHGTVDPDSIGQLRSMGCVRMLADDIAMVYEVLMESVSRVEIHGEDYP